MERDSAGRDKQGRHNGRGQVAAQAVKVAAGRATTVPLGEQVSQVFPNTSRPIQPEDISDALDALQYARADGDPLKIALAEAGLNDLLERYSCHSCHKSPAEAVT